MSCAGCIFLLIFGPALSVAFACLGIETLKHNLGYASLAAILMPIPAVNYPIWTQEAVRERHFRDQYRACGARVRRLYPALWKRRA